MEKSQSSKEESDELDSVVRCKIRKLTITDAEAKAQDESTLF